MTWEHRNELRADPGIAPGERNIDIPRRRSIWPSIAVVAAAAAFGGVIWFAYQNGREAHSGPPPLVKADTSPVKVKPDNPGGQDIPFQDSTVYDRLSQNGQKPVVEKLLPPTEAPVSRPQPGANADSTSDAPPLNDTPPPPAPPSSAPIAAAPTLVPAPHIASSIPQADTGSPTALAPAPGAIITQPPAKPVLATPPKPAPAKAAPTKPTPPTSIAALIADAPRGPAFAPKAAAGEGYRLQLSAVRSPDAVPAEWARLKRRFPELASLKSSTSKVDVAGKGTFYRLEAGPLDPAAAKSTCTKLRAQGLGCIVVKP